MPLLDDQNFEAVPLAVSPDGRFVVSACRNPAVVCDAMTGETVQILVCPESPSAPTERGAAQPWLKGPTTHPWHVTAVAFSPDNDRVVTASNRQYKSPRWIHPQIALWDRTTGKRLAVWESGRGDESQRGGKKDSLDRPPRVVWALAFAPDGKRVVGVGDEGHVWIFDAQSLTVIRQWTAHDTFRALAVAVSRDGRRLATGGTDQTIRLWDLDTGELLASLPGHSGSVFDLAFSPNGTRLASAAGDGTLKIWNWAAFIAPADSR